MIQWVWESTSKVSSFSGVFVATDHDKVTDCVRKFGGGLLKTSPHHRCGMDRVGEASEKLSLSSGDLIVNVQGDEPLISPRALQNLIDFFCKEDSVQMASLAYPSTNREEFQDSNIVKVIVDKNDFALYFSRSPIPYWKEKTQEFIFLKHLGIYGYRMEFLQKITRLNPSFLEKREKLEQLRVLENGYRIKILKSMEDSMSVNNEEDLKKVEELLHLTTK